MVRPPQTISLDANDIKRRILIIRGKQVMLDSDLAELYQIQSKAFNQSVNRNSERFPEHFRFRLTKEEYASLRSQFVTSNGRGGRRYMPFVFTEQGIAMLSAVLKSAIAVKVTLPLVGKEEKVSGGQEEKQPEKQPEKYSKKQKEIDARIKAILQLIRENPSVTRSEMMNKLDITESQVRTVIETLKNRGVIHHEGSDRNGRRIID